MGLHIFDFKQNLTSLITGETLNVKQQWTFVVCIHSGKCKMYTWPETHARSGVNEVLSCASHYIDTSARENVRKLVMSRNGYKG